MRSAVRSDAAGYECLSRRGRPEYARLSSVACASKCATRNQLPAQKSTTRRGTTIPSFGLLEADAEELRFGDHLLLALGAVTRRRAVAGPICKAFPTERFSGLQVPPTADHLSLHGPRHRVVRREVMPGEQRVEHRLADQALREHADRVIGDRVIEVLVAPGQERRTPPP